VIALLNDPVIRAELLSAFGTTLFAVLGLSLAYAFVSLVRHCRKRP
jgi:hypothetical protein